MNPFASILRNWSILGGAQVLASLAAMVFMVIVSRGLGDVEFGRLYLAFTLASIVAVLGDAGLSQVLTRAVARDHASLAAYLARSALLIAALAAALYAILVGAARALGFTPEVNALVLVLGVLIVTESLGQLLAGAFQAHERMMVPALARVGSNVVTLAVVIPLLLVWPSALAVAGVLVLGSALRVAIQGLSVGGLEGFRLAPAPPPPWRGLLRAGVPFLAVQGLGVFVVRIDVVMLGRLASEAAVGWYGAASRAVEALYVVPIMLTSATFPVLSRLWSEGPGIFATTLRKTLNVVLVISVPVAVTLFVLAQDIVSFLFTLAAFAPAVPILRIQAVTVPLVFVDYLLVCALMAIGRERTWLAIVVGACFLDPALDWVLIGAADAAYGNGGIGAALATMLTEVFLFACVLRALPSGVLDASSLRVAARVAVVGSLQGAALVTARVAGVPWLAAAVLAGCVYVLAVIRLRLLPSDLVSWLGELIERRAPRLVPGRMPTGADVAATPAKPPSADAA